MKRQNQYLVAILAIQIILIAWVYWPRAAASGDESKPLLTELEIADIATLIIEDAENQRLKLQKRDGTWVLPDAGDFLAQESAITALLEKLTAINTGRLVTQTDASHKRLLVSRDDFTRRIDLETAGGDHYTLYLGSSPSYGSTHVRLEGQQETYLTDQVSTWDVNTAANSWVDPSYLQVPDEELISITLQNANGEWTVEKDPEGNWTLLGLAENEELDTTGISSMVSQATTLTLLEPLGKEVQAVYGVDEPKALVILRTTDKEISYVVGAKYLEDNSYVVKSSESPFFVRVNEFSVKELIEKTRDDFLILPPTPTAESSQP